MTNYYEQRFTSINRGRVLLEANNNNNVYPLLVCKQIESPIFKFADVIKASVQCTTRAVFLWQIHINPSFVGNELTFSNVSDSSLQFAVPTDSTTISSTNLGQIAFSGYFQQSGGSANINEVWLPELDETPTLFENSGRIVAFSVQKVTGGAEEYIGSLTFKEKISK